MGRKPCCDKVGLKKGPWTTEEDNKLINFILTNGHGCWRALPKLAGLLRCGKSCRLRWTNYLRPDLKRGLLSDCEENMVIHLHAQLGNRWSKIASHLPGRTDNEIKNHWNTHIKKRLKKMGIDPVTHKPLDLSTIIDDNNKKPTEQKEPHKSVQESAIAIFSSKHVVVNESTIADASVNHQPNFASSSSSSTTTSLNESDGGFVSSIDDDNNINSNISFLEDFDYFLPSFDWQFNDINGVGLWEEDNNHHHDQFTIIVADEESWNLDHLL